MRLLLNSILALHLLHLRFSSSDSHSCGTINNHSPCRGQTINCATGEDCTVTCNGYESCKNTTVNCDNTNYACRVNCKEGWACYSVIINGKDSLSLTIATDTTGTNQLQDATVNCPNVGTCSINCVDNYQMCENMNISAEVSTSVNLTCNGVSTICHNIKLYCPLNEANACIVEAIPDTRATTISKIDIYSKRGFDGVSIIGDKLSPHSIGNIHCLFDYISTCSIDENNNNRCTPTDTDKTCDAPNIPDPITTSNPTTYLPTTYAPTTDAPTTDAPTADAPTTDAPTDVLTTTTTIPTNAPIVQISRHYDYEISIEIGVTDLDTDEISIIVLNALNITNDDSMITIYGERIILLVTVPFHLDTDTIEKRVSETLTAQYPDNDIIVKVKSTDDTTEQNDDKDHKLATVYILIIVIIVLLIVVILFVIYYCRKKNKHSPTDINILELSPESDTKTAPNNTGEYNKIIMHSPSTVSSINTPGKTLVSTQKSIEGDHLELDGEIEGMFTIPGKQTDVGDANTNNENYDIDNEAMYEKVVTPETPKTIKTMHSESNNV